LALIALLYSHGYALTRLITPPGLSPDDAAKEKKRLRERRNEGYIERYADIQPFTV
jgi:hypothetical protein